MVKRLLIPLLLSLSACAPPYVSNSNLTAKVVTTGFYMATLRGELVYETINEMRYAIRKVGFPMLDVRYPDARGATHKIEGDLVALRDNNPKPTKLEKAEIRIIDLRTGKLVTKYSMSPENALQVRSPAEFSADIAALIERDFELK